MLHLILVALCLVGICGLFGVIVVFVCWRRVVHYLEARRKENLNRLQAYLDRLRRVVTSLLAQADEVDQESKFAGRDLGIEWSRRLAKTCNDLVVLSESLALIDQELRSSNVRASRDSLLRSCRLASHLARELKTMKRIATAPPSQSKTIAGGSEAELQ